MSPLTTSAVHPAHTTAARVLSGSPHGRVTAVTLAVLAYLLAVRTWNITEIFALLGDQVLHWNLAPQP